MIQRDRRKKISSSSHPKDNEFFLQPSCHTHNSCKKLQLHRKLLGSEMEQVVRDIQDSGSPPWCSVHGKLKAQRTKPATSTHILLYTSFVPSHTHTLHFPPPPGFPKGLHCYLLPCSYGVCLVTSGWGLCSVPFQQEDSPRAALACLYSLLIFGSKPQHCSARSAECLCKMQRDFTDFTLTL